MFAYVLFINLKISILIYKIDESYKLGDLILAPIRNKLQIGIIVKTFSHTTDFIHTKNQENISKTMLIKLSNLPKIEDKFYSLLIKLNKINSNTINIDYKKIKSIHSKILSLNQDELQIMYFLQRHYLIAYEDYIKTKYYFHAHEKYIYNNKGILKEYDYVPNSKSIICLNNVNLLSLSQEQMNCYIKIISNNKPSLIYGVTGSGKTEVYFHYIYEVLKKDSKAQILILLPEITLISQLLMRFKQRFGFDADTWHSSVSSAKKKQLYYKVFLGNQAVIIGTRSSIFLPFINLSLVIMDEEHDDSYKQEDQMLYDTKNILEIFYAVNNNIKICLFSATPSLDSLLKVKMHKYSFAQITSRHLNIPLPEIIVIDMNKNKLKAKDANYTNNACIKSNQNEQCNKNEQLSNQNNKINSSIANNETNNNIKITKPKYSLISKELHDAILEHLRIGNQVMLYCNKRGYYRVIYCKNCNIKIECLDCSAALIFHKERNLFICHYCGYYIVNYLNCKQCNSELKMHSLGIEKLESIIQEEFQGATTILISSDTMSTEAQIEEKINIIKQRQCNIIIATQILAKGHHFPFVNLVGILDIDASIKSIDLYAFEKNFQILSQVSGRAGRVNKGIVYIQTFIPNHQLIKSVVENDFIKFAKLEMQYRNELKMPPFTRVLSITIISDNSNLSKEFALNINAFLLEFNRNNNNQLKILGPTACFVIKLKRKYRYKIILISEAKFNFFNLKLILENNFKDNNIMLKFELDPKSFF
ncbi:MAG: primosomal protein N' [Rickettsiales bacterium]